MTNEELEARFAYLTRSERKITVEVLELILEVDRRKLHVDQGFSSLYDWLIRKHLYSQSAANRRIQASSLLKEIPSLREDFVGGQVNLTTATLVSVVLKKEERRSKIKISLPVKEKLVSEIRGKSVEAAEKILKTHFPEAMIKRESLRGVSFDHSKLTIVIEEEVTLQLKRARELLSHSCYSWAEVVGWLVKDYLKRKDPMLKK